MNNNYLITDAYVLRNHQLIKENLYVENGKIVQNIKSGSYVTLSYPYKIISPGLIDLQINGAFGWDFTSQPEKVALVATQLAKLGVTSFLPTIISSDTHHYPKVLQIIREAKKAPQQNASHILGIHLEGPFFNPEKIGAHPPQNIPSLNSYPISLDDLLRTYGSLEDVKVITMAPELPGILEIFPLLKEKNILIAAGHSLASYKEAQDSFKKGVSLVTHLFNAMAHLGQREPGLIGAALKPLKTHHPIYYSLIADEVHVHSAMVSIAWHSNPAGCILVSDGISALGLKSNELKDHKLLLGFDEITVRNGANFKDDALAGGSIPLNQCIKKFIKMTQCSIVEGLETATLKPAQALGIDKHKGTLNIGADADLVVFDHDLHVIDVFISGSKI